MCHIYLFIFPGIVTTLYKKFTFDGLRYKLRSISCGALSSYTMALEKRKTALLNHRYRKGTWRRPLSLVQGPYTWEQNQWIVLYQNFLLMHLYVKFYKFLSKDIEYAVVLSSFCMNDGWHNCLRYSSYVSKFFLP